MTSLLQDIAAHLGVVPVDRPTAVYRFFDADDQLLYVGITHSLGTRFVAHERSSAWWPLQRSVKVVWRDTRTAALEEERAAIRDEKPLCNVAGTRVREPRVRAQRLDPAVLAAIGLEVRVEIARAGISKTKVRKALGLSTQSLWSRLHGHTAFQDGELEQVADLLGIPVTRFFPAQEVTA